MAREESKAGKPSVRILRFFSDSANQGRVVTLDELAAAIEHDDVRTQTCVNLMVKKGVLDTLEVRQRGHAWFMPKREAPLVAVEAKPAEPVKKGREPRIKESRYATSHNTRLVEHPGAVASPVPIGEVTFQVLGDMVVGPQDGIGGALGGKNTVPLLRDPRNGRLFKLVPLQ